MEVKVTVKSIAKPKDLINKILTTTSLVVGLSYKKDTKSKNFKVIIPLLLAIIPALDFAVPILLITLIPQRSNRIKRPI